MSLPRLTVVVPSYNQGRFIERTIRSIVEQDYPELELILMDGGSTDDTMEILERYRPHFAHFQSQPDGGQSAAIAAGFARATGDFMSWLNSDDTYAPGALHAVGRHFAANRDARWLYGNATLIDADDRVIARKRSARFVPGVMKYAFLTVPQMASFWSRSLFEEAGGLDPSLRFCMDYDLFVRMAAISAPVLIDVDIGNFRLHGESKTSTLEAVRAAEDRLVHERYCRVKPSRPIAYRVTRSFWTAVLVGLFAANGSLVDRVRRRFGNRMHSECA